jgi:hypothetical protein
MSRWARVEAVVDLERLQAARVLLVGLGSGGSTVALELAKAGVGGLTLVDHDRLEQGNVVRHECDDRYLGRGKAEAVAELIRFRNPHAGLEVVDANALDLGSRLEESVSGADLVVGCTDTEPPKHRLNRLCLASGVPAVHAGVYEGGVGGEVVLCGAGDGDPCYACVTSALKDAAPLPAGGEDFDYGAPPGAVPSLGLDVRLVALVHAKICLMALLGEEPPGNVVLFGTAAVEGLFPRPFASAFLNVAPQEGCLVCSPFRGDGLG